MNFPDGGINAHDKSRATEGFTLFAPLRHDKAYLINMDGGVVNQWQLIMGGPLLAIIMFIPDGIWSVLQRLARKKDGVR